MRWRIAKTRRMGSSKCHHCGEYFEAGEKRFILTHMVYRSGKQIAIHPKCMHHDMVEYTSPDNIVRVCHVCGNRIKKGDTVYEKIVEGAKTRMHKDCTAESLMVHRTRQLEKINE
jgi:ribosomal protein L24E